MILIPLHILSNRRPKKIIKFFNTNSKDLIHKNYKELHKQYAIPPWLVSEEVENFTKITGKELKNIIQEKNAPYQSTIKSIDTGLKQYLLQIPGIRVSKGNIQDTFTIYQNKTIYKIIKANGFIYNELKNTKEENLTPEHIEKVFVDSGLPSEIIRNNTFKTVPLEKIYKNINNIRIELILFLLSAIEVEYFFNFLNHNTSLFQYYLPKVTNKKLILPIELWINRTVTLFNFKSHNDFYREVILSSHKKDSSHNSPAEQTEDTKENISNDDDYAENKITTGRRWKRGENAPESKQISAIYKKLFPKLVKIQQLVFQENEQKEALEEYIEHGNFIVEITICLQNLAKIMENHSDLFLLRKGRETIEIANLFQRYTFWYNIHKNRFHKKN